jgi:hypothetical protein
MKLSHGLMVAGFCAVAGVAAIGAMLLAAPRTESQAAAPRQNVEVTATPIPVDLSQVTERYDAARYQPTFLERAKADGFTLTPRALDAGEIVVDVEPCWLQRPLPDLPTDYRDMLDPAALVCNGALCLAGRDTQRADGADSIVDPLKASIRYRRDPDCAAPTPAP